MMVLGKFASLIPLCVLSAILMTVAYNMAGFPTIRHLLYGQKSDMTVFLVSFFLTVFIDLTVAIEIGLLLAAFFFIQKAVRLMSVKPFNIPSLNDKIVVIKIYGSVFFGTVSKVEQAISDINRDFTVLVLDMRDALYIDAAGIHSFEQLYDQIRHSGKQLFIANLTEQPKKLFSRHNLNKLFPAGNFNANLEKAIMEAEKIIEKTSK
jgi:SulP family sulfate permease